MSAARRGRQITNFGGFLAGSLDIGSSFPIRKDALKRAYTEIIIRTPSASVLIGVLPAGVVALEKPSALFSVGTPSADVNVEHPSITVQGE